MRRTWIAIAAGCLCVSSSISVAQTDPTTFEAGKAAVAEARKQQGEGKRAKNVILFVGDGMGISTITAARIFEGQQRGETGEENLLAFESFPHLALIKTYNTNQQIPDSAGTMTALVTGEKTRAGVIAVNRKVPRGDFAAVKGNELRTILEQAEERGLATGIVTTTNVTHATPAALYAHGPERSWENDSRLPGTARTAGFADMARQLIEFPVGDGIDVVLGGGRENFIGRKQADPEVPLRMGARMDARDLTAEWVSRNPGATFVWNLRQLHDLDLDTTGPLLGLFDPSHMKYEFDRSKDTAGEPSLSEMTLAAISILRRNPEGFFLMVEGGRIDHAHHSGNAFRAMGETLELSNAVRAAIGATNPKETLIVVTADHSHVFTLGGDATRGNDVLGKVVPNDREGERAEAYSRDAMGRPYTTLGYYNGPGASQSTLSESGASAHSHKEDFGIRGETKGRPDLTDIDTAHPDFLQEAAVPLAYETHAGEDVAAYAIGPGADLFRGVREQNYIYHALISAYGWDRESLLSRLFGGHH